MTSPRQEAFRISFKEISRGSALVETFGDPAASVTETIYHLDGEHLLATLLTAESGARRCAGEEGRSGRAGVGSGCWRRDEPRERRHVAPRLRRVRSSLDGDRLEKDEIYVANGKEDVTTLALVRVR